ncbi:MAG: transporter substrate-binding domain-containing protein [Burkholderiaceae bacterium]|nr:transporter substrate-binding domain-containing protein [Aquabacterium sp.]NUP84827.1 transporter substrate-binding domain-containing protein [Burkholderiaceae bacterium]
MKTHTMRRSIAAACAAGLGAFIATSSVYAAGQNWKVSLAQMPVYAESTDKGVLVDLVKALERASGDKLELQVVPFPRSMSDVQEKKVDFHMPLIQLPGSETGTPKFDYSNETIFHVNFTMYSSKSVDVTPATASKFKVETEQAHVEYFDFPIVASNSIDGSLKKVNAGRIDAFIFADNACDPIIKAGGLSNVKRQLYKRFDVKVVLPKGGRGGAADKWLTVNIGKLRASGEFDKIMGKIDAPYQAWQP